MEDKNKTHSSDDIHQNAPDTAQTPEPSQLSRRSFITGAAATGALAATSASSAFNLGSWFGSSDVPIETETRQAVVIGSGFGGGVVARALTRAGVKTLVLERGRQWSPTPGSETFPHFMQPDERTGWLSYTPAIPFSPPAIFGKYVGLLERINGVGVNVVTPAAVGGGSVMYHGMTLQPKKEVFERWISSTIDYDLLDRDHFRRVERDLKVSFIPDDIYANPQYNFARDFQRRTEASGLTNIDIATPTDWNVVRKEFAGEYPASIVNGDMVYGGNNGGRYSVDLTYLAEAEATGNLELAAQHNVTDIKKLDDGKWLVYCDEIAENGDVIRHREITTSALFMCAGSTGTTRLMVKAKAKGLIPDLPDDVGRAWGNNGERVYLLTNTSESSAPAQAGPVTVAATDWDDPEKPLTVTTGSQPNPLDKTGYTIAAFGADDARGYWAYNAYKDDAFPIWDSADQEPLKERLDETVSNMANAGPFALHIDTNSLNNVTFHPVGGMSMGSVCDDFGRVHNQRGLYVADGSLLPGTAGATNPSMTIAALAEYAMDEIIEKDLGTVF